MFLGSYDASGVVEFDNVSIQELYIPRLADLSGYTGTVSEEHPALEVGHNFAPTVTTYPSALTFMDRSNSTYWTSLATSGVTYDSGNKSGWEETDQTISNMWDWGTAVTKNMIYNACDPSMIITNASGGLVLNASGYPTYKGDDSDVTAFQMVLIYMTERTATEAVKVVEYLNKQDFKEK